MTTEHHHIQQPFLTGDVPPVPGVIRTRDEDFVVEEIPAYQPCGSGDHCYITIEKQGLTTRDAVERLARALDTRSSDVGYAGMKDAHAVTRQTVSVEHVDPDRVRGLSLEGMTILAVDRHTNKLRLGHLRGNRFVIRIRNTDADRLDDAQQVMQTLARRGVPNYFGSQRFGSRRDTHLTGLAMLRQDYERAIHLIVGTPSEYDSPRISQARQAFEEGRCEEAIAQWPARMRHERDIIRAWIANDGDPERTWRRVDRSLKRLYVSAVQSYIFNRIVADRLDMIDRILPGDIACKHINGATFVVDDPAAEQVRADALEISATAPLLGYKVSLADGEPGRMERQAIEQCWIDGTAKPPHCTSEPHVVVDHGGRTQPSHDLNRLCRAVKPPHCTSEPHVVVDHGSRTQPSHDLNRLCRDAFATRDAQKLKGERRPVRFVLSEWSIDTGQDDTGHYIELRFTLPAGCFATSVLREICKRDSMDDPGRRHRSE